MYARQTLHHRQLWSAEFLSRPDVLGVLETARSLKQANRNGQAAAPLRGRNVALLDDTVPADGAGSLRHAATALGAKVSHLRPSEARIAAESTDAATVRMLGRLYDAIDCEDMPLELVARVARDAGVPVFNGLGNPCHPLRVLGDLLTMQEHSGKTFDRLSVRYAGDPRTPCAEALLRAAASTGMELRIASARDRWPPPELWERLKAGAVAGGERLRLYESPEQAGDDADILLDAPADAAWTMAGVGEAERSADRRFALQALLLATIN